MHGKKDEEGRPQVPLLVRPFRGEEHELVQFELAYILFARWQDTDLES